MVVPHAPAPTTAMPIGFRVSQSSCVDQGRTSPVGLAAREAAWVPSAAVAFLRPEPDAGVAAGAGVEPGPGPAVDPIEFFGLRREGPGRWLLPVERPLCSGTGALFGGAAIGAAVAVIEEETQRALVWTAVQFATHVRPPATLAVGVEELARGRRASQARLVARLGEREVFSALATVGHRDDDQVGRVERQPPPVPRPEDCPPRPLLERHRGGFMERTEARLARAGEPGSAADGRSALWARIPGLQPGTVALAVFGDYVPFGVRQALGEGLATHSLDNTVRVLRPAGPGWVLADIAVDGVDGGFGYGRVDLWDAEGRLLATASQSFTCRRRTQTRP